MRHPYVLRNDSSDLPAVISLKRLKTAVMAVPLALMLILTVPVLPVSNIPDVSATPTGQIGYPVPSPSNPDIIAYIRKDDDRSHLHLYHVTTRADEQVTQNTLRIQTPGIRHPGNPLQSINRSETNDLKRRAGVPSGHFEGDFSWSPVLDQFGSQWFAFSATHSGKTQLHIGHITSSAALSVSVFPIDFGTLVTNPVFSPDGNSLVFSADGDLYLVPDISTVIRKRDFTQMNPLRITDNPGGSFFPDWSHDSRLIAYQNRPVEGERQGFESLFIIDAHTVHPERIPRSHLVMVSDAGSAGSHHLRPSWSPFSRTLAFFEYYDPAGVDQDMDQDSAADGAEAADGALEAADGAHETADGANHVNNPVNFDQTDAPEDPMIAETHLEMNIRAVQVAFNQNLDRWIGQPIPGRAGDYIAESAVSFSRSAPQWASIEFGRRLETGILWIRRDPGLGNPLYFSDLTRYSQGQSDFALNLFSFSNRFSWLEPTTDNRYPAIAQSDEKTRYLYVTRDDDEMDRLVIVDRRSTTLNPLVRKEIPTVPATIRSGLYPGWGHFHIGESRRGAYLAGTFTALAGATVAGSVIRYQSDGSNPGNAFLISLGAATAAVWAFNLFDLHQQLPAYREFPVSSTFGGYAGEGVSPDQIRQKDITRSASKRRAMLYSALYPGLGHLYINQRPKAYVLGSVFTVLAGSTFAGAAYRYHYPGPTPSDEVLIGMGAATLGIWIYSLIDLQQSFTYAFFADAGTGHNTSEARAFTRRPVLALGPKTDYLQMGNKIYKEYAAIGLTLSF